MEQKDLEMFANIVSKAIESLNDRFDKLEQKVDHLDLEVRDIKLSIDNEINPKISIIAEGHLDLKRKLDQYIGHVIKVDGEFVQLNLRMVHQESELIKVEARLDGSTQTA